MRFHQAEERSRVDPLACATSPTWNGYPALFASLASILILPLADHLVEPLMCDGGSLAGTFVGSIKGLERGAGLD